MTGRTKDYIIVEEDDQEYKYRIHAEFKFDSTRKRMSVIAEEDGQYYFYTKGADNCMIPKIEWDSKQEEETLKAHLHKFAIEGLRTLVMGKKKITKNEFESIISEFNQIQSSDSKNKDELFAVLFEKHESKLNFMGASAIEDKLQDKVPETIAKLMEANIRVWVLTGDKQETAIEIAKSCQLIQENMEVITLTVDIKTEKRKAGEKDENYQNRVNEDEKMYKKELINDIILKKKEFVDPNVDIKDEDAIFKCKLKDLILLKGNPITIVIDGPTLALILGDEELEKKFLSIGLYSKSVVCCRVSPKQKSLVVGLINKYKKG